MSSVFSFRQTIALISATTLVLAQITPSVPARAQQNTCDVAGQWKTSFGLLNLSQTKSGLVSGVYQSPGGQGRLQGRIAADRLDVTWSEPPTFAAPDHAGAGNFQISEDCTSLSGEFRKGSQGAPAEAWRGKRLSVAAMVSDDQPLPADLSKRADQLKRIAARLRRDGERIPKTSFDIAAVLADVGKDPATLRSWVAAQTRLVPYRGMLRGPVGVLMDRRGNSLDRALLLASLLKAAGHEVRLARATLDEATAAGLLEAPLMPMPAAEPQALGKTEFVKTYSEETGIDPAQIENVLADLQAENAEFAATMKTRVQTQVPALLEALAPALRTASDLRGGVAQDLIDHWWVQHKGGKGWIDLELSTPDGAALKAPEVTFAPEAVPEELQHKATVRVTAEFWEAGALRSEVVLEGKLHPADLPTTQVVLKQVPTTTPPHRGIDPELEPNVLVKELARETTWLPVLTTVDGYFAQRTFSVSGNTAEANESSLSALAKSLETTGKMGETQAKAVDVVTRGLDTLLNPLDRKTTSQPQPLAAEDKLTAEWVDLILTVPGEPPIVHRRTIFDLLGADARASQPVAEPIIDDGAKQRRALALAQTIDLLFIPANPPPQYLSAILARDFSAVFDTIASAFGAIAVGQTIALPSELPRIPSVLYAFAARRLATNADAERLFIDRTNVVLLRHGLRQESNMPPAEFMQIDVVENSVGVNPTASANPFLLRLTQGVVDTATEAILLDSRESINTSQLFQRDRAAGKPWLLITNATMADQLLLPTDDRQRIAAAITNGGIALVRPEPIEIMGRSSAAWWRVDVDTGTTLGIGADGAGQDTAEVVANFLDMAGRLAGLTICIVKAAEAVEQGNEKKALGAFLCMVAHTIGIFAQREKLFKIFGDPTSASSGAIDLGKSVGTGIGVGGTIVAW